MSEVKELLNKIKVLLGATDPKDAPKADPKDAPKTDPKTGLPVEQSKQYQLQDGTNVEIDKLEVGGLVIVNGQPIPAGEYTLNDGTSFTTDENGSITEVETAEAEKAEDAGDFKAQFEAFKTEFNTYKENFESVKAEFAQAKETISKQDEAIKGLLEVVEKLAKMPTEAPVETPKSFKAEKLENKEEKLAATIKALKEKNK